MIALCKLFLGEARSVNKRTAGPYFCHRWFLIERSLFTEQPTSGRNSTKTVCFSIFWQSSGSLCNVSLIKLNTILSCLWSDMKRNILWMMLQSHCVQTYFLFVLHSQISCAASHKYVTMFAVTRHFSTSQQAFMSQYVQTLR